MYEHQGLQDELFIMLYGGATMMAVLAAMYLLLRRANAVASDVDSPRELRCWAAVFLLSVAASHIWWYVLGVHWLTDDRLLRNIIAITLDRVTLVPLMMCVLLRMLQHYRYPLWIVVVATVPFVVIAVMSIATHDDAYEKYTEGYSLLLCLVFLIYYIYALRKYDYWLRDNFADLEHKEVWQSLALLTSILLVYVVYTTNEGALAMEYLSQLLTLVIIGFVVWRVETLSLLSSEPSPKCEERTILLEEESTMPLFRQGEGMDEVDAITSDVATLLTKRCEATQLYLQYDLTLSQLADEIGISREALSTWFIEKGDTYHDYINRLRINHFVRFYQEAAVARHPFTIFELAHQCGYRSYSYFTNAFKQCMGSAVTEWVQHGGRDE